MRAETDSSETEPGPTRLIAVHVQRTTQLYWKSCSLAAWKFECVAGKQDGPKASARLGLVPVAVEKNVLIS